MAKRNWNAVALWVIAIAVVVMLVAGLGFFGLGQTGFGGDGDGSSTSPSACAVDTKIDPNVVDFYKKSTSVGGDTYVRIDGGSAENFSDSDNFNPGDEYEVLAKADNYISAVIGSGTLDCGINRISGELKATDNPSTFEVKDDSGTTLTDDATGGAVNASSTSGSLELDLRVGSSSEKTTGDLIVVVEYDNTTEADSISMSNAEEVSVPEIYSDEATNSLVKAFRITEIEDGSTATFTVKIEPESGQTLGSNGEAVRFTRYSEQADVDTDGSYITGVEDTDGTAIYEDTGDYDVFVV